MATSTRDDGSSAGCGQRGDREIKPTTRPPSRWRFPTSAGFPCARRSRRAETIKRRNRVTRATPTRKPRLRRSSAIRKAHRDLEIVGADGDEAGKEFLMPVLASAPVAVHQENRRRSRLEAVARSVPGVHRATPRDRATQPSTPTARRGLTAARADTHAREASERSDATVTDTSASSSAPRRSP